MPSQSEINKWRDKIRQRYQSYLRTSFYFKDGGLRDSFRRALDDCDLMKGAFPEAAADFKKTSISARCLAQEFFGDASDLVPGLLSAPLYDHQERTIRSVYSEGNNAVVATGTASGKTESFLYPVLFDLYRQYKAGQLNEKGVRALVLYPMNALANDQRRRLGEICEALDAAGSGFKPTFGQYIGGTPDNTRDKWRNANKRDEERLKGELVFRDEMRDNPPHILLTNYSMLEYLLIRPEDSNLFDSERGKHWRFLVLDEAHQYRGARGMEMGMLVRRLKQRLRDGGREGSFSCIATSATIASGESAEDKAAVARFAGSLFGEPFADGGVIFGKKEQSKDIQPRRFHVFMSALEGAFLVHEKGKDKIALNRQTQKGKDGKNAAALEIALCKECGQHYYVGRKDASGYLSEAVRDPSHSDFGVDYYLPLSPDSNSGDVADFHLCRCCGKISGANSLCDCGTGIIAVKKCETRKDNPDQLKKCEVCEYRRGGIGDPVQEIVHGADGPNTVIATALHELLPEKRRKVLSFADSRQEAAFFAWYAGDSYKSVRDRNFTLRALRGSGVDKEGLSVGDLQNRLLKLWNEAELFTPGDTQETRKREMLKIIFREALTEERRISLAGVGVAKWFVDVPSNFEMPKEMFAEPWNFTEEEARDLLVYLLDGMRYRKAVDISLGNGPVWGDVSTRPQSAFCCGNPSTNKHTREWGGPQSATVQHFLSRIFSDKNSREEGKKLMKAVWHQIRAHDREAHQDGGIFVRAPVNGAFRLNHRWLRIKTPRPGEIFECNTCASLSAFNIRSVCPRNGCPGILGAVVPGERLQNHYLQLYEQENFPAKMIAEEHTAQVESEEARRRQDDFKSGKIHLLSSSTTFEVGVDLGDLEVAFLRNVPPEPFNYTQRVGRVGRGKEPGMAITYCRRNPHDLYHYADPEERVMKGKVNPPQLRMKNARIISRHVAAAALAAFFKQEGNAERFDKVKHFVGDWGSGRAAADVTAFCKGNAALEESLRAIVPDDMHGETGLIDGGWVDKIAGNQSALANAELVVCEDYRHMRDLANEYWNKGDKRAVRLQSRQETIANEKTLVFLSRKAVIPKYGFPVDVVELDTRPVGSSEATKVSLQRDLSQAIAEYAPGGEVVANKKVWKSCGVKKIPGKEFRIMHYKCDGVDFNQWEDGMSGDANKKYLWPEFGFVTPLLDKPKEPSGRPRRLYTTRPFFCGFNEELPKEKILNMFGVGVTKAQDKAPQAKLVVLCEGKSGEGFYICHFCGAHYAKYERSHKNPEGGICKGKMEKLSLGHELVTDVARLQFPGVKNKWESYSLAYAVLLGAAETLNVPETDLNVTITGVKNSAAYAIVLYDNVPGGAGLVVQLEQEKTFLAMLCNAKERVNGGCGCGEDASCYGCLRSFRNQFAHPHLRRKHALKFLNDALDKASEKRAGSV